MRAVGSPAFEALAIAGDRATARVARAHVERLCAGHFPGDPFVPGAYLVELMAEVAGALHGGAGRAPRLVERAAFHRPVRPDAALTVHARRCGADGAEAEVQVDGRRAATARVRFAPAA